MADIFNLINAADGVIIRDLQAMIVLRDHLSTLVRAPTPYKCVSDNEASMRRIIKELDEYVVKMVITCCKEDDS
jgi:hypothetical protein